MSEAKKGKIVIVGVGEVGRSVAKFGEQITLKIAHRPEELCFVHKIIRENIKKPSAMFMCTWGAKNV